MANQVSVQKIQLPADFASKLAAGIAESRASTIINAGGKPLLRIMKDGRWVFGQSDEEVQDNSRWLINIATLAHGYCCWVEGSLRGEVLKSVFEVKPTQPPAIDGVSYKEQRAFDLKCIDGDDAGTEVLYKTSSKSGMEASDKLFAALQSRIALDQAYIFPAVVFDVSHYEHKQYGRIYTPIMEIVGWHDANGAEQPAKNEQVTNGANQPRTTGLQEQQEQVQQAPPPARTRKAPLGVAPQEEPQTTQQAHAAPASGRRRPGR